MTYVPERITRDWTTWKAARAWLRAVGKLPHDHEIHALNTRDEDAKFHAKHALVRTIHALGMPATLWVHTRTGEVRGADPGHINWVKLPACYCFLSPIDAGDIQDLAFPEGAQ